MDACTMTQEKALKYDMLKTCEQKVLKQRPIKKSSVTSLLKATLITFLKENGIVLPPQATNKNVLVDMVIDLVTSDPVVKNAEVQNSSADSNQMPQIKSNASAPKILPAVNTSVDDTGDQSLKCFADKHPSVIGNRSSNHTTLLPAVPKQASSNGASSTAIKTLQNNTPPAADNPWDNPSDINTKVPQTLQATSTTTTAFITSTKAINIAPKVSVITTAPSAPGASSVSSASTVVAGSFGIKDTPSVMLEPCNAIYFAPVGSMYNPDDENWDIPPACGCVISVKDLTEHLALPSTALEVLKNMTESSVQEIIEFLQNYGEENISSGCRVHLLMTIRDLLEEETKAIPSNYLSSTTTSTTSHLGLPKKIATPFIDPSLKRSYQAGPGSSSTSFKSKSLNNIQNKISKCSNFYTMTSTPLNTSSNDLSMQKKNNLGQSHPASTSTSGIKNIANIPAALGAPIEKTPIEQQAKNMSQDFNKMMAQQVALQWSNPKLPIPLAYSSSINKSVAIGSVTTASSSSAPTANAASGTKELDREKECCICIVQERQMAFVPCGHAVCCINCANKLRECPVCRKKVKSRLQLYFS